MALLKDLLADFDSGDALEGTADTRFNSPSSTEPIDLIADFDQQYGSIGSPKAVQETETLEELTLGLPVPPVFNAKEKTRNAFQGLVESMDRGSMSSASDLLWYGVMEGKITAEEAEQYDAELQALRRDDPVEYNNWFSKLMGTTSEIVGGMSGSVKEGTASSLVLTGAYLPLGQAGPQAAVPFDEMAVAGAGFTAGSWNYWRRQGAGNIYRELHKEGYDDSKSKIMADIGGALYAGIESMQFLKYIPGLSGVNKTKLSGKWATDLSKFVAKWAMNVGEGSVQEGVQAVVTEGTKLLRENLDEVMDKDELSSRALAIGESAVSEFIHSLAPMAVLGLGSGSIGAKRTVEYSMAIEKMQEQSNELQVKAETIKQDVEKSMIAEGIEAQPEQSEQEIEKAKAETDFENEIDKVLKDEPIKRTDEEVIADATKRVKFREGMSDKLVEEIEYRITNSEGELDEASIVKELIQDMDDKDQIAYDFRKELQQIGIDNGIFLPKTKAEIDNTTSTSRKKKYDFKRGDTFYVFDTWENFNTESTPKQKTKTTAKKAQLFPTKKEKPTAKAITQILKDNPTSEAIREIAERFGEEAGRFAKKMVDPELRLDLTEEQLFERNLQEAVAAKSAQSRNNVYHEGVEYGKQVMLEDIRELMKLQKIDTKAIKKLVKAYAKENLGKGFTKEINQMTDRAIDKKDMARVLKRVDVIRNRAERRTAVNKLKITRSEVEQGKLAPEFKEDIVKLIDSVDMRKLGKNRRVVKDLQGNTVRNEEGKVQYQPSKLEKLQTLREAFKNQEQDDLMFDDEMFDLLNTRDLDKKNINELTVQDIEVINDTISYYVHQQNTKNMILVNGRIEHIAENKRKIMNNLESKKVEFKSEREVIEPHAIKRIIRTESKNAEHLAWEMDNGQDTTITDNLYKGIDKGISKQLNITQKAEDTLSKARGDIDVVRMSEHLKGEGKVETHEYKLDSGKKLEITKAERISLYLHSLNDKARKHMIEGGIKYDKARGQEAKLLTLKDIQTIKDSMTSDELQVAQGINEYLSVQLKQEINQASNLLLGYDLAVEDNYFPIKVSRESKMEKTALKTASLTRSTRAFVNASLENMGILKHRTNSSAPIILEDAFKATNRAIESGAKYAGLAIPLRDAKAILYDTDVKGAIENSWGKDYWNSMQDYISEIESSTTVTDLSARLTSGFINKIDSAVLGANPFIALKQVVSYTAASLEIAGKYLAKAALTGGMSIQEIMDMSPQMRDRFEGNVTREIGELNTTAKARKFWGGQGTWGQKSTIMIKYMDKQAIQRIWKAAELEINEQHPELNEQQKKELLVERAEEIVRLTQPTFHLKDRSKIGRSEQVSVRLLTKYSSQRNKNFMMFSKSLTKFKRTGDYKKLSKDLATLGIIGPAMLYMVEALKDVASGKEPEDRKLDITLRTIESILGNVYYVGTGARTLISLMEHGVQGGYDLDNVLYSKLNQLAHGIANTVEGLDQLHSGEIDTHYKKKWKKRLPKGLTEIAFSLGAFTGLPLENAERLRKMIIHSYDKLGDNDDSRNSNR